LLQQLLRPCQRLPQLPSRKLLLDTGAAGLKACVRGAFTQGGGGGLICWNNSASLVWLSSLSVHFLPRVNSSLAPSRSCLFHWLTWIG
jgi:hypothetical protein